MCNHFSSRPCRAYHLVATVVFFMLAVGCVQTTLAQTTIFNYTGRLVQSGTPANGNYDMTFSLFDALSGGAQIGSTITQNSVGVSTGTFSVPLDFGASAFPGANRFLEISVRQTGVGSFQLLSPRTQLASSPYAIRALTVSGPVTNAQPGITNASPANLPPSAFRAEATATTDTNAGVIGIA